MGNIEELRLEGLSGFQQSVDPLIPRDRRLGLLDLVIGRRGGGKGRIGGKLRAQVHLLLALGLHQSRIVKAGMTAIAGFTAVLNTKEFILRTPGILSTALAPRSQEHLTALEIGERNRVLTVAKVLQLGDGEHALRAAGMPRDEG